MVGKAVPLGHAQIKGGKRTRSQQPDRSRRNNHAEVCVARIESNQIAGNVKCPVLAACLPVRGGVGPFEVRGC
eukprot:1143247-Pelagomonas_calceolata.AAC.8